MKSPQSSVFRDSFLILTSVALSSGARSWGAMGEFDTTWNDDGKAPLVYPIDSTTKVEADAVFAKPGGGLLVVGRVYSPTANRYALNYNSMGGIDTSAAVQGAANLGPTDGPSAIERIAGRDSDGRIYGSLYVDGGYFRLTSNGEWDLGFGVNGKLSTSQDLGTLVISNKGTFFAGSYRLLPTLFVDPSFGNNGRGPDGFGRDFVLELNDSRLLSFRKYTSGSDLTQSLGFQSVLPTGQVDTTFNPSNGQGFLNIQRPFANEFQRLFVLKATAEQNGDAEIWIHNGSGQIERILIRRDGTFVTTGMSPVLFDPTTNRPAMVFPSRSGRIYVILQKAGGIVVLKPDFSVDLEAGNNGLVTCEVGPPASQFNADWDWHVIPEAPAEVGGLPSFFALRPDNQLAKYQGETDGDRDGIPDRDETGGGTFASKFATGTKADSADSDGDGVGDGFEVYSSHTNPNLPDSDGDGFIDGFEIRSGYSPTDVNSKPAALLVVDPAVELSLFTQIGKTYRIQYSEGLNEWHDTPDTIQGTGDVVDRIFEQTKNAPRRFWRAVEISP
jgi:hypothetical protein